MCTFCVEWKQSEKRDSKIRHLNVICLFKKKIKLKINVRKFVKYIKNMP